MRLEHYIADLLYRYNCVVIPEFGAFLANTTTAQFVDGTLYPPSKHLSFNQQLTKNDGLLVSYVANVKNLPYDDLLHEVLNVAKNWKEKLANGGRLDLDKIGSIWMGAEGKLQFSPEKSVNFLAASFGLTALGASKVKREALKEAIIELEERVPFAITPEKRANGFRPYYKYAAVFLLLLATGVSSFQFYTNGQEKQLLAEQAADEKVNHYLQEATFFQSTPLELPAIEIAVAKDNAELAVAYKHHIIAGAFRVKANADRKVAELKRKGFDARYIGTNAYGLHQVAYQSFVDGQEALQFLRKIKQSVSSDAWMASEK